MCSPPRLSVCIVGVVRPTVERAVENVVQTVRTVRALDPYADFVVLTYQDEDAPAFLAALAEAVTLGASIRSIAIPTRPNATDARRSRVNTNRMFASVRHAIELATGDVVLRTRLDCALVHLALPPGAMAAAPGAYYYVPLDATGESITDNIGFASRDAMLRAWTTPRPDDVASLPGRDNEAILLHSIERAGLARADGLAFEFVLHQSGAAHVKGVPQWSRRSRSFRSVDGRRFVSSDVGGTGLSRNDATVRRG